MGNFHYTVMLFDLKNPGATYQCAMTIILYHMLHGWLEEYVHNIVVKSKEASQHVNDLK